MRLTPGGLKELHWWVRTLQTTPVQSLHKPTFNCHFYSDAAKFAWGPLIAGDTANGAFSTKQQLLSINTRELLAIYFGLMSLRENLRNKTILCHCDNTTAVSCILKHRSADKIRNIITINIFDLVDSLNSAISAVHLRGSKNSAMDSLSHKSYANRRLEWSLSDDTFAFIKANLPFAPNIDLFASHLNNKLPT